MKQKQGFCLRNVLGEHVLVAEGMDQVNFNKMIVFNPSAALLWENVAGKEFGVDDLASILTEHYDVDSATAAADAAEILDQWVNNGIVEA